MTGGSVPVAPSGSEREAAILRPPIEPCVHYPALTIHREIMDGLRAFMDALEDFYLAWAREVTAVTQPPKQLFCRPTVRGE
jgi:hypothetical protein